MGVSGFAAGIARGQANGQKTSSTAATRGGVLKALYIAAGSPAVTDTSILSRFNDVSGISADIRNLKGGTDGNANWNSNVTRGHACALAGRALNAPA